jgi:hypothetical protein
VHLAGNVGAWVDGGVPLAGGQGGEVTIAVTDAMLEIWEELAAGPASVEQRDLVARRHGLRDEVTAYEASTADDQNPHRRNLVGPPPAP